MSIGSKLVDEVIEGFDEGAPKKKRKKSDPQLGSRINPEMDDFKDGKNQNKFSVRKKYN